MRTLSPVVACTVPRQGTDFQPEIPFLQKTRFVASAFPDVPGLFTLIPIGQSYYGLPNRCTPSFPPGRGSNSAEPVKEPKAFRALRIYGWPSRTGK